MKLDSRGGGDVFGPQLPRTGWWQVTLPLSLIRAYRRIPCKYRASWSMGSSTSHLAEQAVAAGGGWASFRRYTSGWKFLPSYAAGAGLRHLGVTSLLLRRLPAGSYSDIGAETHGWGKSPYPPLPHGSISSAAQWDGRPAPVRGEPYTSPWYGRSQMGHWLDGNNPGIRPNGSAGWGGGDDVWKHVTRAGTDWDTPRNAIRFFLLAGLLSGLGLGSAAQWEKGSMLDRPRGYPANPPPKWF